jgi:cysteine desulfurase/selenocysteine lyase
MSPGIGVAERGQAAAARPAAAPARAMPAFDPEKARADFPIFGRHEAETRRPLIYLDSASSAQKPQAVIDAVAGLYAGGYANIHRGLYELAARADAAFEGARETVRRFLGAPRHDEVVFTRGTTDAINLVARSHLRPRLSAGDEVVVTELEHHSNIVPWQIVCEEAGARVRAAPIDGRGDVDLDAFAGMLGEHTRMVAVAHVSNVLGTVVPVAAIARLAHERGAAVLVDGAQAAPHLPLDVGALGCDFYCFSSHKLYGPTGIGVLWGRHELLAAMPPAQGGGDMIRRVSFAGTTFADPPARFAAGTPHIAGAAGLAAAIDYLGSHDPAARAAHEEKLLAHALERLSEVPGLTVVGAPRERVGAISFTLEGVHPHDVAQSLAAEGIAVRAGHHCAQPLMERLGVPATTRASFGLYNTRADADALAAALGRVRELFG